EDRPLEYRDIVILLRATKGKAELLLDVLRKYEIPCYAEVSGGYFAATEIKIMLSLLQIIDNPRQDIPLAAVLRSPILGLQAEELAEIRNCLPRGDFWDALQSYTTAGMSGSAKLGEFIRRLDEWRTVARRQPLSVLIWQLLQETGIYDYVGSMPGGVQRQANLRALYTRACQYEQTNFRGLFRFLRFIEMLRQSGSDLATARTLGENENVVRIM
ncbi:MAG TPA: helicase-exonuclease AddAB subunit AddA, partial [Firmicutes bacterium]|nr:helicase-exonuclease AddAB subunit AddA [Bacillota bacterium]